MARAEIQLVHAHIEGKKCFMEDALSTRDWHLMKVEEHKGKETAQTCQLSHDAVEALQAGAETERQVREMVIEAQQNFLDAVDGQRKDDVL
jgi:hypothetical protein